MGPEFWISLGAVFVAGGAVGTAGTLLSQWIMRKVDQGPTAELDRPEYDVLRREVAELGRQMRNVDARLDFTEKLLGGALPLGPPPSRFEPADPNESDESAGEDDVPDPG